MQPEPPVAPAPSDSGNLQRLLVLLNPGRVSRNYLDAILRGAAAMGMDCLALEIEPLWKRENTDPIGLVQDLKDLVEEQRIGAVLGFAYNALVGPNIRNQEGRLVSLFEALNVPTLMLWTDHPQWVGGRNALEPDLQPIIRTGNNHHFVKSEAAAEELRVLLKWQHCYGVPMAEDPEMIHPAVHVKPDFDVVAVTGPVWAVPAYLQPFLDQDRPDCEAIMARVAEDVRGRLKALWAQNVPEPMRAEMEKLGEVWVELRRQDVRTAAVRHLRALQDRHPEAADWLLKHYETYFSAVRALWEFGAWQRQFYLVYLAKHFRVQVFGPDSSKIGMTGGGWVDYRDQAAAYARGRMAINISVGHEEEGLSHKPFQIAASGVPMVHIDRKGLGDCFEVGNEVAIFNSPADAREVIADLLAHPDRLETMGQAAHHRFLKDHTWAIRLRQMFVACGLPLDRFVPAV